MKYKVRCVGYTQNREKYFTRGKVYDVVDDHITNDNGFTYWRMGTAKDVIDWLKKWYKFERVDDSAKKIVITTDGKTTLARLYEDSKVVHKAEAKCSPDDAFNFEVGAKLAMERLLAPEIKDSFVPHLESATGTYYGNIGEATNYKDVIDCALFVGDTVNLYHYGVCKGEYPIVRRNVRGEDKTFVMSIEMACDDDKGTTEDWKIIKKRSFDSVKDGETVGCIKYVKKE